jgi:hypothetical protein
MLVQTLITDYFTICMNNKMKQIEQKQSISRTLITEYFEKKRKSIDNCNYTTNKKDKKDKIKVCGYNPETDSWHCLECGDDMGRNNPRQLCGKYFCRNL